MPSGADGGREPAAVADYFRGAAAGVYDQRDACARWAGTYSATARASGGRSSVEPLPARFIVFPAPWHWPEGARGATRPRPAHSQRRDGQPVPGGFLRQRDAAVRLRDTLANPKIEYSEPDCDGPDFLTTSIELLSVGSGSSSCWQRAARADFPNDPCIDELWGHRKIGWNSDVAARSLPRVVAVLDSGIDAAPRGPHQQRDDQPGCR